MAFQQDFGRFYGMTLHLQSLKQGTPRFNTHIFPLHLQTHLFILKSILQKLAHVDERSMHGPLPPHECSAGVRKTSLLARCPVLKEDNPELTSWGQLMQDNLWWGRTAWSVPSRWTGRRWTQTHISWERPQAGTWHRPGGRRHRGRQIYEKGRRNVHRKVSDPNMMRVEHLLPGCRCQ